MDDTDATRRRSVWKPNWAEMLGEGYKEILKILLVGALGFVGVFLGRHIPVVGEFLSRAREFNLYQVLLWVGAAFILGFCIDRLIVGKRMRRLDDQATKDELTGLLNLRMQKRVLPAEIQKARERQKLGEAENRPVDKDGLSVIFVDIDNFKRVNDTATYESGNFVLQQFAELLSINRKVTDQVFRYGGDEFLILAPQTPRQGALMYAEKLRSTIATTKFKAAGARADVSLTISAGVAEMRYPDKDTAEDLLKRVTEALTRAKKARNSVELYQPPVEIAMG